MTITRKIAKSYKEAIAMLASLLPNATYSYSRETRDSVDDWSDSFEMENRCYIRFFVGTDENGIAGYTMAECFVDDKLSTVRFINRYSKTIVDIKLDMAAEEVVETESVDTAAAEVVEAVNEKGWNIKQVGTDMLYFHDGGLQFIVSGYGFKLTFRNGRKQFKSLSTNRIISVAKVAEIHMNQLAADEVVETTEEVTANTAAEEVAEVEVKATGFDKFCAERAGLTVEEYQTQEAAKHAAWTASDSKLRREKIASLKAQMPFIEERIPVLVSDINYDADFVAEHFAEGGTMNATIAAAFESARVKGEELADHQNAIAEYKELLAKESESEEGTAAEEVVEVYKPQTSWENPHNYESEGCTDTDRYLAARYHFTNDVETAEKVMAANEVAGEPEDKVSKRVEKVLARIGVKLSDVEVTTVKRKTFITKKANSGKTFITKKANSVYEAVEILGKFFPDAVYKFDDENVEDDGKTVRRLFNAIAGGYYYVLVETVTDGKLSKAIFTDGCYNVRVILTFDNTPEPEPTVPETDDSEDDESEPAKELPKFEAGKTYFDTWSEDTGRSHTRTYTVVKRTAKTIVLKSGARCSIGTDRDGGEVAKVGYNRYLYATDIYNTDAIERQADADKYWDETEREVGRRFRERKALALADKIARDFHSDDEPSVFSLLPDIDSLRDVEDAPDVDEAESVKTVGIAKAKELSKKLLTPEFLAATIAREPLSHLWIAFGDGKFHVVDGWEHDEPFDTPAQVENYIAWLKTQIDTPTEPPTPESYAPSYRLKPAEEVECEREETRRLGHIFDGIFKEELARGKTSEPAIEPFVDTDVFYSFRYLAWYKCDDPYLNGIGGTFNTVADIVEDFKAFKRRNPNTHFLGVKIEDTKTHNTLILDAPDDGVTEPETAPLCLPEPTIDIAQEAPIDTFITERDKLLAERDAANAKLKEAEEAFKAARLAAFNAADAVMDFMEDAVDEMRERIDLPDEVLEVKTMEGNLAFINAESVYVDFDATKFILRGDCSELNGLTLGTYDTPEQVERAVEQFKAAINRGDKRFAFPPLDDVSTTPLTTADDFITERDALWNKHLSLEAENEKAWEEVNRPDCDPQTRDALIDKIDTNAQASIQYQNFMTDAWGKLRDKIGNITCHGIKINGKAPGWLWTSLYGGKFQIVCWATIYAEYDTPAQVEEAVRRLKEAMARGDTTFTFPTIADLSVSPVIDPLDEIDVDEYSISPDALTFAVYEEEAQAYIARRKRETLADAKLAKAYAKAKKVIKITHYKSGFTEWQARKKNGTWTRPSSTSTRKLNEFGRFL